MDNTKEERGSLSGAYKVGCFIVVMIIIALLLWVTMTFLYSGH